MAKKISGPTQRKSARSKRRERGEAPLNPEEILQLENSAASAAMPTEIASRLTTRRLLISGIRESITPHRSENGRGYEIVIPKNAVVGVPGKTAHRMVKPRGRKKASRRGVLEGFRPRWVDRVYHPKRAVVPRWAQRPASAGGRTGEVYWGVFPP